MTFALPARGEETSITLLSLVDPARTAAQGGTVAGLGHDPGIAWVSPVAAAGAARPQVTLEGRRGYIEDTTVMALGAFAFHPGQVISAGVAWYDAGTTQTPKGRVNAQQDLLAIANACSDVNPWSSFGTTVKFLRSELVEEYSTQAVAFDAGIRLSARPEFALGGALENKGSRTMRGGGRTNLASSIRAGFMAMTPLESGGTSAADQNSVSWGMDAVFPLEVGRTEWRYGGEYLWHGVVAARAGAVRPREGGNWAWSFGFGITTRRLRFDYASRFNSPSGTPHALSMTILL
jgi:hypothetical protein